MSPSTWKFFSTCLVLFLPIATPGLEKGMASVSQEELTALLELADGLLDERDLDGAEKAYKKALKVSSESPEALKGLGKIGLAKEDWGDVKKWFGKALELDSRDPEANYFLGIAHRETGKHKGFFLQGRDLGKSRDYFDAVIAVDSSYQDVLLQRGLAERRDDHWKEAVEWALRQVEIRPELAHGQVGLFKLQRLLLRFGNQEDIKELAFKPVKHWGDYFGAEKLRYDGQIDKADSMLQALLDQDMVSYVPVLTSLARLSAEREDDSNVIDYYWRAVDSLKSDLDAEFLFEDAKFVFDEKELDRYFSLTSLDKKQEFFYDFWARRDAVPATEFIFSVVEHYQRLVVAEKDYWFEGVRSKLDQMERVGNLRFPVTYDLNQEFNDKGIIYVRHGEPDRVATSIGTPVNESWLYYRDGDRPKLVMHFVVASSSVSNNWQFTPYLEGRSVLSERLGWDSSIYSLYHARTEVEYLSELRNMAEKSEEFIFNALTTWTYSWDEE